MFFLGVEKRKADVSIERKIVIQF